MCIGMNFMEGKWQSVMKFLTDSLKIIGIYLIKVMR